jgi:GlcNAc-P-P-Und epimerase
MINSSVLITGASGFIGTNLLEHYASMGYRVRNIDIRKPRNTTHLPFWANVDITDLPSLRREVLEFNPDYIVHLAARTDLDGEHLADYSANTVGVRNLIAAIAGLPRLKKIIIASSMLVCRSGYAPRDERDYCPNTVYGESKVETEKIVRAGVIACDWAIIRPTSIWGPWFDVPYRGFFDLVRSGLYFHIGRKSCVKTYGYVGNAVYQIEKLLFADTTDEAKKVFYIGDSPPTNIEEWANEIAGELGKRIIRMPYSIIRIAACLGDLLKKIGIGFPMTSFRLRNMMTNNVIDLSTTAAIAPNLPFGRIDGVRLTLDWMRSTSS